MKEMEEKLADMNFCRGNKGYLINLAHVDGITDGCAMVKGEQLVLSRARKKEFMEELTKYSHNHTRNPEINLNIIRHD